MAQPNAADRKSVRRLEKDARQAAATRDEYTRLVMSTPTGRAWLLDLLDSAHVFASSFTDSALRTSFLEGERNIGLRLLSSIMQSCPDQFVLMMQERNHRDAARDSNRPSRSDEDARRNDSGPVAVPTDIVIDGEPYVYNGNNGYDPVEDGPDEDGAYQH